MAIGAPRSGKFPVWVYDAVPKRKVYIGSFDSREDAEVAQREHKAALRDGLTRTCPGCRKRFRPIDETQRRCSLRCEERIKRRERRSRERQPDDHWVYTCLNAHGEIIYVGITSGGLRRHREHAREAFWWKEVATITVEHFDSRDEALQIEAEGIQRHQPRHNVILLGSGG